VGEVDLIEGFFVPMRVSTLSDVVSDGGIAGTVWAAAKRGNTSVAQAAAAARNPASCFMVSSPLFGATSQMRGVGADPHQDRHQDADQGARSAFVLTRDWLGEYCT
jgi:hypothetical protein